MCRMLIGSLLALGWLSSGLQAGEDDCKKCNDCRMARAETAQRTACYAVVAESKHYIGYYVGGGCALFGRERCPNEGTWGWDYQGCPRLHKVILNWCCRYQGGMGAYATVGHGCGSNSTP